MLSLSLQLTVLKFFVFVDDVDSLLACGIFIVDDFCSFVKKSGILNTCFVAISLLFKRTIGLNWSFYAQLQR